MYFCLMRFCQKNILLFSIVLTLSLVSCTKRMYISEEVIYSVDENRQEINTSNNLIENVDIIIDEQQQISSIIEYAESLVGSPYKWGGTTPEGFDCSGFIQHIYLHLGIEIPRMPLDMAAISEKVDIDDLNPGDLIYFKGSNINSDEIGHIAMVVEKTADGFKFIHSTTSKGVIVSDINQYDYWISRYLFATRFKKDILIR